MADDVVLADARDPIALRDAVAAVAGGPADVTVVCVDVPGCEGGAVLTTASGGTVIFFSMATSFSAAALGAEGLAADVTMLVGNGYVPGPRRLRHGAAARGRRRAVAVRAAARVMPQAEGQARPRPGHRPQGPLAGPQGRRARSSTLAKQHTTVSVERATLRMAGLEGADGDGIPWANRLMDVVRADVGLEHGVALPVWDALVRGEAEDLATLAQKAGAGSVTFRLPEGRDATRARAAARKQVGAGLKRIDARRRERERLIKKHGDAPRTPWIYLIVATGDIMEDIPQAQQAAREGADVIAVIRSTGQSLLDYVPEGATREGFAGTYATQENFRLMRAALDESSRELGRYVRLTNYASGLCMPEIATLAGLERLDMMLNDSMYGILFRDINPMRTFVDQRFSRQVHARAGIIINTGEDNYLTTADAVEAAHTVTTSQLLNEYFAKEAGLEDWQLGLGHAFEIDPELPNSFRMELAHALLARELFPDAPLKWMPPTRHMTGDVFRGNLLDGFFNLVGALTGQGILLVGMMTEAVVTPWLSDRDIALQNVRYVLNATGDLHEDFRPAPGRLRRQPRPAGAGGDHRPARGDRRRRAAQRDRRRHVRPDAPPGRRRPRPRRRRPEGERLLQPGVRAARGAVAGSPWRGFEAQASQPCTSTILSMVEVRGRSRPSLETTQGKAPR